MVNSSNGIKSIYAKDTFKYLYNKQLIVEISDKLHGNEE